RRRTECDDAVARIHAVRPDVKTLRDVSWPEIEQLASTWPDNIRRRARHVTTEILRVHAAVAALRKGDFAELRRLISEAHVSLDIDYEVSSAELHLMVALANRIPGLLSARMTGAGFGGCTINLVLPNDAAESAAMLAKSYEEKTRVKPDVYVCRASDGVEEIV